jgi:hypothetical protein
VSAVNQLVGKLVGQYAGPILVVGGAPGALEELEVLKVGGFDFERCLIISANEHAIHAGLKAQFACVNDDIHHTLQIHQEPRLRELMPGVKLLSRHWWADYRSPQLMACNSGLKALLYAAILGANPIIVVGIQHYHNGLYFHEDKGRKSNPNLARDGSYFNKQTTSIKEQLQGVPVRTISGPLTHIWPKWKPEEKFTPRPLLELERKAQADAVTMRYVCTLTADVAFEGALIPERFVFAVTRGELLAWGHGDSIEDATHWDLENVAAGLAASQEARRAEQVRLRQMISRLRASRRGISRSIYDADIVRIIRWTESGELPEHIAGRTGLPKEQVAFIAKMTGAAPLTEDTIRRSAGS